MREINFILDLLPTLSQKVNAILELSDSIDTIQVQLISIIIRLSCNAKTNEEIKREMESVKSNLAVSYERANQLEAVQKRTNLMISNYTPQHLDDYALKQVITGLLNRTMPSLEIN